MNKLVPMAVLVELNQGIPTNFSDPAEGARNLHAI